METSATPATAAAVTPTVSDPTLTLTVEDFSALLERGQRPLYAFLCGIVGDDEQARDLMQDTFYEAWRVYLGNAPPFDGHRPESEVRRWLFRVAYRRAVSTLRRRRIVRWHSLDMAQDDERAEMMPVAMPFEERLVEDDAVRAALATLAPTDVACLTLIVVHGFTAAEAGLIVGASAQAVAKRFARAKQRLRAVYLAQNSQAEERRSR